MNKLKKKHKPPPENLQCACVVVAVVNEVEQRLLQDVKFAKENGVSLAQVLRKLAEAKRR